MSNFSRSDVAAGAATLRPEDDSRKLQVDDLHCFLEANREAYESLVDSAVELGKRGSAERTLSAISSAAQFASRFHPGLFSDGRLENIALELGGKLDAVPTAWGAASRSGSRRHVLHVASSILGVGGHSRMLHRWITEDSDSLHSVVVTSQGGRPIPSWLANAIRAAEGRLVLTNSRAPHLERARVLRKLVHQDVDLVVLHHGGADPVPTVALARTGGPPVAVVNHADHVFWLGSSVSDVLINLRSAGGAVAPERRGIRRSALLPIPVDITETTSLRADARARLGIPLDQTVLLSVGRAIKYLPCGPYDFVATANMILAGHPNAHLYVVGASVEDLRSHLRQVPHERLHFVGALDDPRAFRDVADIYLESFPFGSNTAVLEAAVGRLPVVPAYRPICRLLVAGNDSFDDLMPQLSDEKAYINLVATLIDDPAMRAELGDQLRERVVADHCGTGWLARLGSLYRAMENTAHTPQAIPAGTYSTSDVDVGLSIWGAAGDGYRGHGAFEPRSTVAAWRHSAFVAKDIGNQRRALTWAWRSLRAEPWQRASWRLLLATLLTPLLGRLRRMRLGSFLRG